MAGGTSVIEPMEPCYLWINKVTRLVHEGKGEDLVHGDHRGKQESIATEEMVNFCEKQAMIQFETIPRIVSARGRAEVPEKPTDTFDRIFWETTEVLLRHTIRDWSLTLTDLLQMKQGDDTWMQVISDVTWRTPWTCADSTQSLPRGRTQSGWLLHCRLT